MGLFDFLKRQPPAPPPPNPFRRMTADEVERLVGLPIKTPLGTEYATIVRQIFHAFPPRLTTQRYISGPLQAHFNNIATLSQSHATSSPFQGPLPKMRFDGTMIPGTTALEEIFWAVNADRGRGYVNEQGILVDPDPTEPVFTASHELYIKLQEVYDRIEKAAKLISYGDAKRYEHTQIVGGSGAGKTTLLSHLILHDLHKPNPPSIILIDPKNLVIPKLSKLALFDPDSGHLKDRLIVLSPEYKPAINIFDNTGRSTAGAIDSLKYLCGALSTEFTTLQEGLAANLARLLLVFPQTLGRNATLADLRALMVDKFPEGDFRKAVASLRPVQREFFQPGGFDNSEYRDAKRQIRRRLDQMIGSEHLESVFYSQRNAINLAEEMQKGSIILVDCAERLMDTREEASAFGCVVLAEVMRAITQRNALPDDQRRPCFLFVDEAAYFFRGDMNYFFEGARQCHVGGVFAFHYLSQKNIAELRDTMMVMTATKLLSRNSKEDAPAFAKHMGYQHSLTEFSQFLDGLPPYHFALSIAGVQEKAVGITAPPDELKNETPMSDAAYQRFLARNKARVSGGQQQRQSSTSTPPPPPDEETEEYEGTATWTQADDLDLGDCLHQQAVAARRGDTKRYDELEERIEKLKARKAAAEKQSAKTEYRL
jgi:hypothetical protein